MTPVEYARHDALGLAALIRQDPSAAHAVLEAAFATADAVNPGLNCLVTRLDDMARAALDKGVPAGPLGGVPFVVKDDVDVAFTRTTRGSAAFEDAVPQSDAEIVARVRRAGLLIFAKANMP